MVKVSPELLIRILIITFGTLLVAIVVVDSYNKEIEKLTICQANGYDGYTFNNPSVCYKVVGFDVNTGEEILIYGRIGDLYDGS